MNLIAQRPKNWNDVVGQERALTVLRCILTTARFLPRGFLFKGPIGVGKTATGYLLARALMCAGTDPLGCGKCASCKLIDSAEFIDEGLNLSGNFVEIDAASNPYVEHARNLMDIMNSPSSELSRRRVVIIDEAHRLSTEAWDVFLKPLETNDTNSIFIFASSDPDSIPLSIRSRVVHLPFQRIHADTILGLLVNLANRNDIQHELDALKVLARKANGIARDAVNWLGVVGSMGKVTKELVNAALDDSLEEMCHRCYTALIENNQVEAVKWIDEAGRNYSTSKVVEVLFSIYARTPWAEPGTLYAKISSRLPNISEVGAIFIKWMSNRGLPSDALPLVVYELLNTLDVPANATSRSKVGSKGSSMGAGIIPASDIEDFLNN